MMEWMNNLNPQKKYRVKVMLVGRGSSDAFSDVVGLTSQYIKHVNGSQVSAYVWANVAELNHMMNNVKYYHGLQLQITKEWTE